ncbi:hypothetical protein [Nonomuraea dietziae]|uniref:Uncharacterized protein n=1 Tax=Nonomuraea dietziae TaxID=65515 RepID=A0A7W5YLQ0_9ACTN|nr:hypothetical protein [Nonomuraea dietziae]MBB3725422.1 hypothetical protein [Nonomuraea dietziae]
MRSTAGRRSSSPAPSRSSPGRTPRAPTWSRGSATTSCWASRRRPSAYPELGADAFGHSGAVGAQSFADPRSGIAYACTRRRFSFGGGGGAPENRRLVASVMRAANRA